jgi:hypothetical protein
MDARAMMNPIIRDLYDRAINNFTKIPEDRQEQVMNLVTEIENVAKTGNQAQLLSLYKPLSQLMEGVN